MYGIGYISRTLADTLQVGGGLGKPTIKFEFEDNQALADFLTKTKGNVDYAETVDADTFSNPMTVNNRRQSRKTATQQAITTTPTNYLPPSDGTPSLPPSPTSPKALPEYKENWTLSDIVEHSRNVIGKQYVLFENDDNFKYNFAYRWYLDFNIVSNQEICILLRYNSYYDNEIKQNIDININDLRNKEFWKNNAQSFELVKKLINVSPLLWQIIQIYKPLNDIEGYNYRFDYKDFNLQYWFDDDAEFYHQGFICRISIAKFVKLLENQIIKAFSGIDLNNKDAIFETCYYIVLTNDIISYITGKIPSGLSFNNITSDYAEIKGESFKDGNFVAVKLPNATNEQPVPTKPKALPAYNPQKEKYLKAKAQYPDAIIIFYYLHVGVSLCDDATLVSIALNLPIYNGLVPFTQINDGFDAVKKAAEKLQSLGYNVVVVDQYFKMLLSLTPTTPEVEPTPEPTEPEVVKFTPKKPKQKKPEKNTLVDRSSERERAHKQAQDIIYNDKVEKTYLAPDIPVKTLYLDDFLNGSDLIPYFKNKYGNDVLVGMIGESKKKPTITFVFDDAVKVGNLIKQRVRGNNAYIVIEKNVLPSIRKIKDVYDVILFNYKVKGLGKPTIKLEFEDNGELMSLFDTDGINGMTVNDKPAAVFNCPESELNTQGFAPTYIRLADYSHLIDAADGAKTLKGYGFEKATLDELINACQNYRQVERLAAHLKDDDEMQSAFNIWHWLHTNVRYNYDAPGEEEIRTPARVWADRESGVDCDCLAVFTACLLICMGYKPKFEIVAFNNSPTFSHIYVNLDGMAIDRVLPVFLARPGNITKTQIMDIPVYSLSGIDGCNTLSGVYASTLAKVQNGTATGEDLNNLRKTEVLLTLKGLDDDEYKLAKILMPYVVTIGDDGKYYFDNAKLAAVAQKVDAELALLKQQNATPEAMTQWLANVLDQLDGVSVDAQTPSDDDTIVVIINPKGCPCHVTGQFVSTDLQTLTPDSSAASTAAATASPSADSPLYATTPAPIATPPDAEPESGNTWLWIAGFSAAFGIGAALASSSGKKKRR